MQGTYSRVDSLALVTGIKLLRPSLVFWGGVFSELGTLVRIVLFFVAIVVSDLGSIFAMKTSPIGGAKRVNTSDRGRAFYSYLAFLQRCFFFSSQVFLSEVLPFSDREEYRCEECGGLY